MRGLKQFLSLPAGARFLLLQAVLVVSTVRVALWLLPFATVQRLALRAGNTVTCTHSVEALVWAVSAVSRRIPGCTCLTQAFAAQVLLGRSGHHSTIQIGVAKDEQRRLEAHAWLVFAGRVILGGEVDRYASIVAVEAKR